MLMKTYIFIAAIFLGVQLQAQSIERQVIGAGGLTLSNDLVTLDFTVGETVVTTITNGNSILMQGFHQIPFAEVITVIEPDTFTFSLYPNPTSGVIFIQGKDIKEVEIYSITGQKVFQTNDHRFDISQLSSGIYIARIRTGNKLVIKRIVKE